MISTGPIRDISNLTPAWLTAALGASGALVGGEVVAFVTMPIAPVRSQVLRLELGYSAGATGDPPRQLVLKLPQFRRARLKPARGFGQSRVEKIGLVRPLKPGRLRATAADLSALER